jgi:hypothetical protein
MVVWEGGLKRGATVAVRSSFVGVHARSLLATVSPPLLAELLQTATSGATGRADGHDVRRVAS